MTLRTKANLRQVNVTPTIRDTDTPSNTYTILDNDSIIVCNKTVSNDIILPVPSGTGRWLMIANVNTGVVTVSGLGASDRINGEVTQLLDRWATMQIIDYATNNWVII